MSTKNKIIGLLEQNRSSYVSGQELADQIGISRAAIWKIINQLKQEGYEIDSSNGKGYLLKDSNDILSEEAIRLHLNPSFQKNKIIVKNSLDSTNTFAKILGMESAEHGTVVVANEQTKGRGRFGRTFFSEAGKGIYLSVILRPQIGIDEISFSTILTVVAVMRGLRRFTTQNLEVKWVNDIFSDGKKVCGILTELMSDVETQGVDFLVAGIGINFNAKDEDFAKEIRNIAGSVFCADADRNRLIAEIVSELLRVFDHYDKSSIIEEYKSYQLALGKRIIYTKNGEDFEGIAQDITQDGALVVVNDEGKVQELHSGEISIKMKSN